MEQDLALSRAISEIFSRRDLANSVVFRGGSALHKLFFRPPGRYSEDIDLVQREAGPIGTLINGIREALDPWLGTPKWKAAENASCARETQQRIRDIVTREASGERFVTEILGRLLGLS